MPARCIAPSTSQTALVIDSGPELNELLNRVLSQDGWAIDHAANHEEALELAKRDPFDLIITGRKTRGPEDIEFLRKIRGSRPHVRMIILADEWTPGDVLTAMREGAFSYFCAPFQLETIAETVRTAMNEPCWDDGIEVLSATPEWVRVMARCDLETAERLVLFLQNVRDPNISESDRADIVTAFREILLNAMEYGGKFQPNQYVEISYVRAKHMVMCRVKDPGEGFSLDEIGHAAIANPDEDPIRHVVQREAKGLRPGGYGVLLAQKLVDELIYNEKGNEVLLVKYVDRPGAAAVPASVS